MDSGVYDASIVPKADHTLDSLSHLSIHSDQGYPSSLCTADFSSIGSFTDSGFEAQQDDSSGASLLRRSAETPSISTSDLKTQSYRASSWHENTMRKNLRNFAHKMNFSEQEFEQSMQQLGEEGTDRDKLLKHLVNSRGVRPTSQPKSARAATKKPSSSRRTRQCEGDSKGLRHIVIDGSNVAME